MQRRIAQCRCSFAEYLHQFIRNAPPTERLDDGESHGAVIVDSDDGDEAPLVHHAESHHFRCRQAVDQFGIRRSAPCGAMTLAPSFGSKFVQEDAERAVQARVVHGDHEKLVCRHSNMIDHEGVRGVSVWSALRDRSVEGAHRFHEWGHRVESGHDLVARALR